MYVPIRTTECGVVGRQAVTDVEPCFGHHL
jgi:hypothetical protein